MVLRKEGDVLTKVRCFYEPINKLIVKKRKEEKSKEWKIELAPFE